MKNKHILYILLFLNSVIATKAQSGNEANNSEAVCVNPPSISLNPTAICSGTSSLITALPTNGGITPFYTWKRNNVVLPLFTNKTILDGLGDNNVHRVFRITNNIYAATDIGLSISTNSGNTFSNRTKLANGLGNDVVLGVFVSPTKIYAATAGGLSISSDGGNTFINKTTTDGLGSNIVNDVFVDATGNTIYAATASGLSVSTNAGLSFVNKSMSNVRGIFVNGNNIYAATSTGLNISTDGGANFTLKTTANGLGNNNVNDVFKVGSIIYAATSGGLSISTDGGVNFNNKTTVNGLGDNNVSSVYAIGSFIYASTVGGLSMSNDDGNAFFINKTATDGLGTNTVNDTFAEGNYICTATTGGLAIASINTYQVNNAQNNDVYSVTILPSVEVCPSPNPVTTSLTISPLTALTINSNSPVCSPSTLTLTASGCAGTVTWSQGGATGTSLTLSTVGTYSISATCSIGACNSNTNTPVFVEIKAKPTAPTITAPENLVVCSPSTLTLTASGCAGTITWSQGGATGSTLIITSVGTYSISATCTVNSCTSDASATVTGLEIKAKPNAPIITPPTTLVVCSPSTLTLIASGCAGTVTWSNAATGTSLTISAAGTYSISATCTINGCTSDATTTVTGLEIKAKPDAPIITPPTTLVVCSPSTLTITASGCAGTVTWSNASTGTSITLSTVGTYSLSAICTINGCSSEPSSTVSGLEIKAKPSVPTIVVPTEKVVCFPATLILTVSGCAGTVTWSNASTGTSITLSTVGTYSLSAICTINGCSSEPSSTVSGLEIKAKPSVPTIVVPTEKVVCFPATLILTVSGCAGTVTWSNASTGTSITLSAVGTYAISATCTINSCTSDPSSTVSGLEIKAKPSVPTIVAPTEKVVCFPATLTLTVSGCVGTVTWSNAATGTSITLSTVGTYSLSAICTINGCSSEPSSTVSGLEIKAKPSVPTIVVPTEKVVCFPATLILTVSGCAGTVTWSNASTGTSITLSAVGTYAISATCTINSCTSDPSSTVSGLEIKAKPSVPTIVAPTEKVVCFPATLTLTVSGCIGTVTWSHGAATGTSLTISGIGTYSITATCTVNGCTSDPSSPVNGLEIKAKPNAPTITPPVSLSVCSPNTLTLTASGCAGTVTWSEGAATGISLTLSLVGTYSITATCTVNGCTSDASSTVSGLEIKAKPNAPTITPPPSLSVCSPNTLTLTASGCAGTVTWSQAAATGTSLTISGIGTYSITATCTVNGCTSDASSPVTGLEIKPLPNAQATNTGPYTVGQTILLNASGGNQYSWTGPNNFTSASDAPTINNALPLNGGIYTVTATNSLSACSATATTNVVVNGLAPCDPNRIVDYQYVKAGNPYQVLFPLTNGMVINQITDQVSILVTPSLCPSVIIESFNMNIRGPELNWNIVQSVAPNALFDNAGTVVYGRNFLPGTYTLTVTGYLADALQGGITYGPVVTTFTVVGNLATISMPTIVGNEFCAGANLNVNFSTTGTFDVANLFQVQLSDANGSFEYPVVIGTTNIAGTVSATIPANTPEGTNYLIRVASSNPVLAGNPTTNLLTINPLTRNLVSPTNDLTGTNTKKAVIIINASNKVTSPANVSYQAGKAIILTPGFESGAVFKAEIKGCSN